VITYINITRVQLSIKESQDSCFYNYFRNCCRCSRASVGYCIGCCISMFSEKVIITFIIPVV